VIFFLKKKRERTRVREKIRVLGFWLFFGVADFRDFKFAPKQHVGRENFCAVHSRPIWRALLFSFSFFILHHVSSFKSSITTGTAKLLLLLLLLYLATFMLFYVYFNCKARSKRTRASIFLSSHSRRDNGIFFAARWCCCCERFLLAFTDSSSRKRCS
jgi:hypothetical protein